MSEMTLRTDLKVLDQARRVVRVHGGVKSVEVVVGTDDQFGRRTARKCVGKADYCGEGGGLLRPNTTVFLIPAARQPPWHAVCRMSRC